VFGVIFLDNRHRIIAIEDMFFGTIDGASVHPRVVVERALELHAAAVVLYHNHPSGITEPSQADIRITGRIKEALDIVDVTFRRTDLRRYTVQHQYWYAGLFC
jgi:DNA repair protein RadC